MTGDSFDTEITLASKSDLKTITKKNGWLFNWKKELNITERQVYKLTIADNPEIIQGLVSLEICQDHVYMHLIESAYFNRKKSKVYEGVPGNLVAFACHLSINQGFEGNLSFLSKTVLISHYEKTLGAEHFRGGVMIIKPNAALKLIEKYFKNKMP